MRTNASRASGCVGNLLADALPAAERDRLLAGAQHEALPVRRVLFEPDQRLTRAYFPLGGVVSLVTPMLDGSVVEMATIGREGVVGLPALLVVYIRARVPESPVWLRQRSTVNFWASLGDILKRHWLLFIYVIMLMTAFNAMSHGTQDMYQTFLGQQRGFSVKEKSIIGIVYAVGGICGGIVVGHLSQKFGRRRLIVVTVVCTIILIPAWVFSPGLSMLLAGGFLMQSMVQGVWGIVPVHLNELSPGEVRGTFPGFAYQLGNLFAANTAVVEARLAEHFAMLLATPTMRRALPYSR